MNNSTGPGRFGFYLWTGAAWLLLWVLYNFFNHPRSFGLHTMNDGWQLLYLVGINFLFFEYSLPFIRKKRASFFYNILAGIFLVALQLALVSIGLYGWTWLGIQLNLYTTLRQIDLIPGGVYNEMIAETGYLAQTGIAFTLFVGFAYLAYNNFRLKLVTQQQQITMREAELNYLKSQTNPHFLFNTLNNIYVLATENSEIAPESILRLSKILRFMLYETGSKFIPLEKELEIITDYIALEKLRYDNSLNVKFTCDIGDMQVPIRPLLLIPLVENAFKHGVSEDIGDPFVDIRCSMRGQLLTLVVKNSSEMPEKGAVKENIGLANLKRQLQLLYADHTLTVEQGDAIFTATLQINLTSDNYDKMYNSRR